MNETKEVKDIKLLGDEKEKMSPEKRRDIIKTIIIIFLAIMLVLTFFSNTIMNKSLAEISTESVTSGKLTERIEKSGTVEANQSYNVTVEGNRVVEKIHIKKGQEVQKGDVLFTINTVSNDKLEEAEAELDKAKLEYETALLVDPVDYSDKNQEIKAAREELNAAIAKRDAARANEANASYAKSEYSSNKAELEKLTAEQEKLMTAVKYISMNSYDEAPYEYVGELPLLYSDFEFADSEYKEAAETYQTLLGSEGANLDIAKAERDAKQAAREEAERAYNDKKNSVRSDLNARINDMEEPIADLKRKTADYEAEYGEKGTSSYETLADAVIEKQNSLEKLIIALDAEKKKDSITDKKNDLDFAAKKKNIEKLQEKVDKMKKESKASEVKSKYSGVVNSINVQPDATTTEGDPLAVIDLVEDGFTVKISVENQNLKKIKKGMSADILNNYGDDIEAVLTDIKNDSTNSKNKELVFAVTGDVEAGEELTLSIPLGTGTYDAIVPRSAVKSDNGADAYLYKVRTKNTPLGNRYYVEKVNVNVEAKDATSCAVSGGVSRDDYVITAASKPIRAGDQIRMKDK
ncbi:HlyD family efflux transporter periplasmic adaptor subunit [Ruminococcus sp.]|jgi:multidrug efflux pump subunit AcrA (membrane-fusion protein)|uniref:HlyD family efflux transporter periplasmic adaptor subunit n=1 Tax=Ruminococcus sp. TaxID=41978 RepID=UPI0025F98D35|nr:HlyD family efflux transporter periplasmic adaptor subunit [Ruminococcus sp.]